MIFAEERCGEYRHDVICIQYRFAMSVIVTLACSNGRHDVAEPKPLTAAPTSRVVASAGRNSRTSELDQATTAGGGTPAASDAQNGASAGSASSNADVREAVEPLPSLRDASGLPLPQTEELPRFDSPSFERRIALLFEAIVKDDPGMATPAFFPVIAYEQVKAVANPARDHKYRLLAAFAKNIHEYHAQLGERPDAARLVAVEPPKLAPRWMKPGTEGNRLGYYRLLRSQLRFVDARGVERKFEVTSMISWRGEWYVVHLNGFK